MIVWSGKGYLVAVIAFAISLLIALIAFTYRAVAATPGI